MFNTDSSIIFGLTVLRPPVTLSLSKNGVYSQGKSTIGCSQWKLWETENDAEEGSFTLKVVKTGIKEHSSAIREGGRANWVIVKVYSGYILFVGCFWDRTLCVAETSISDLRLCVYHCTQFCEVLGVESRASWMLGNNSHSFLLISSDAHGRLNWMICSDQSGLAQKLVQEEKPRWTRTRWRRRGEDGLKLSKQSKVPCLSAAVNRGWIS